MHELSIASAIVAAAERSAEGLPVTVVRARIGRLRQVVPESLAFSFPIAARGTLCEQARLDLVRVPARLCCGACGQRWDPAPPPANSGEELIVRFGCPGCGSSDHEVVSGDELIVDSIDVLEPAPADGTGA